MVEAILNGTFVVSTNSDTAFHFSPEMLEFGFPPSHSNACCLNRTKWDELLDRAVAKRYSRRDTLTKFLLVWSAMYGSMLKDRLTAIIPDNPVMISLFREILYELHDGIGFHLYEYHHESDVVDGKSIYYLTVYRPEKLCSVLLNVLGDDNQYVPETKATTFRQHAAE
eukprot:scaffold982_cov169-Amphora_coffeaeformis.AAC.4